MKLEEEVLDGARFGLSVLPWQYVDGSKKPMMRWKDLQQQPLSPAQVEDWWRLNPDHNWGVVTGAVSSLVIVDLDDSEALIWAKENLPRTEWVVTTGRGQHWGYRHPGGVIKNRTHIDGMNIDLRGDGGWAAMPPSLHKTGEFYRWSNRLGYMPHIDSLPVFDAKWFPAPPVMEIPVSSGNVGDRSSAMRRAAAWLQKRPPAIEGCGGDAHTFRTCAMMVRDFGLSESDAFEVLIEWNNTCEPPWDAKGLRSKIRNAAQFGTKPIGCAPDRQTRRDVEWFTDEELSAPKSRVVLYEDTDIGNGERFADQHADRLRYCHELKCWYVWGGKSWEQDKLGATMAMAKITARGIAGECSILNDPDDRKAKNKWSMKSRSTASLKNMITLAQCEGGIPVRADDFDSDAWIINTPSGIVDLRCGQITKHDSSKMCSKITKSGVDWNMKTPTFDAFMDQTFGGDEDLKKYVMQALGFSLTGSVREHVFFFCYGTGANGKGTLLNLAMEMMGDYAAATPEGLLMARQGDKHLAELIMLKGLRMAVGSETQEDRRLNEARMKNLTGGDPITADPKGGAYITFKPTHSLWLIGNHKPRIKGVDNGVWRRTRLIPFDNVVPDDQQDKDLEKKLWAEREGIMAKIVDAAASWYHDGFVKCAAVDRATQEYRNEEDAFGQFINDSCTVVEFAMCSKSDMRQAYIEWARRSGGKELTERSMNERLRRLGYKERRVGNIRHWVGLCLPSKEIIH